MVQMWIRAGSSLLLPGRGGLVPKLEPGILPIGRERRPHQRRCAAGGSSGGTVVVWVKSEMGTTDCEACSGHLPRFERCCGVAGNPPEMLQNLSDCPKKAAFGRVWVGSWRTTGDR